MEGMPADTLTLPPALTAAQTEEARAAYANVAIEGTSLSEAEALEIAAEFLRQWGAGAHRRTATRGGPELRADRGRVAAGRFAQRLKEKPNASCWFNYRRCLPLFAGR